MRRSNIFLMLAAVVFGLLAVSGVKAYLDRQQALFAAQANNTPAVENTIVVANRGLRFGSLIESGDLKEIPWASKNLPEGAFAHIKDVISDQGNRYSLGAIAVGEPVIGSKITKPGEKATLSTTLAEGKKAVTIRVNDVLGVAGFVLPGDLVDVMLTRSQGGESYVDVLLQGVRVLAIDQEADEKADKPSVVRAVTFEVDTIEAQKLALGAKVGQLSLALRNKGQESAEKVQRVTLADLDPGASQADQLREKLALEEAKRLDAEKARQEALSRVEQMVAALGGKLDDSGITAEKLNAEIEAQIRKMEDRLRKEMADKNKKPAAPVVSRVGVMRGVDRTEYTVRQ